MIERIIECSRCGVMGIIPERMKYIEDRLAHYYCADCLISMMPEQLEKAIKKPDYIGNKSVEKRVFPRFPVFAPVRLSPANRGIEITSALIIDASLSGVRIMTRLVLQPNENIIFTISGGDKNYHAAGKVMFSKLFEENGATDQYHVGIQLTRIIQPEKFMGKLAFQSLRN